MNKYNGYTPRHAGSVCTDQADWFEEMTSALEDAQSWLNDAESAATSANEAIVQALEYAGI